MARTRSMMMFAVAMSGALVLAAGARAGGESVALPIIEDATVAPRVVYLENPRFPALDQDELQTVVRVAADLVQEHFGVTLTPPRVIPTRGIDRVFRRLAERAPAFLADLIGDFRNDAVDWTRVEGFLAEQIEEDPGSLDAQIAFAAPHLRKPPEARTVAAFVETVADTFRTRLGYWTEATLADGHPIIGAVPGRDDLPLNEYGYWTWMAKRGIDAEIVLTNQLVASVEYMVMPVHTAIRGGITGGSTEYNPESSLGASVWVSLAPFLLDDPQITALRGGETYARDDALRYAGVLLAHELGHLLLHLGHPWGNDACVMRPAEVLDFAAWAAKLDAGRCPVGSEPQMTPGAIDIPVW